MSAAQQPAATDTARWKAEAARVTIVRDDWGIAHVHGKSDADAVFGMVYAQCEDDFNRVETNYLTSLGRTAEAAGESAIWQDLRQRLFLDPAELQRQYAASPEWLKRLMNAWADGINYYLAQNPETKPKVLTHFEPWMALSFTEGSIGGDIERINLGALKDFYDAPAATTQGTATLPTATLSKIDQQVAEEWFEPEPSGSNGFAIAPDNTVNHHALLLINPHTSFFFRSELQMTSDERLNAYGAVTWGQFFIYQGFNDRAGWMHTSSNVDAIDEYREKVVHDGGHLQYVYGDAKRDFTTKTITLHYKTPEGLAMRTFTALYTLHGPVIRRDGERYVTIQLMNIPVPALQQSYMRIKARSYAEYKKTMELKANSSNNTIFADADGDIAYWHGNFIPVRNTRFDYTRPVDGSDPETNWNGLMTLEQIPHLLNPASGFLFNVNDSPWNGSGDSSLRQADYPAYVEQGIESARGLHAMRVLAPGGTPQKNFSPESLLHDAAFDSYLPWFGRTIPALLSAYDALPSDAPMKSDLAAQIAVLRKWDERWSADSVATSVAVFWGTELMKSVAVPSRDARIPSEDWVATRASTATLLTALKTSSAKLAADFGSWQTPWGEINRFQRLTGDIVQPFNDAGPSIPVPFPSSLWGSLASFGARQYRGTKKWYGTSGNSFVAVVEFGPKVRALGVTAGGESGHPQSKHFNDEAERYASGNLREIYFYPEQLRGHTERTYHPGE
jgi:acyl-homoserine lactone acylase PvdQ